MHKLWIAAPLLALPVAGHADETQLGVTVANVAITKPIPSKSLSLKNMAAVKTVAARGLRVVGEEPEFTVTGQVFCKSGARLTAVQVIVGHVILHNGETASLQKYGQSPKLDHVAGRSSADVSIPVKVNVTRMMGEAAIDLSFNPVRTFEQKLNSFAAQGGSELNYLRQTQAFDMPVTVNLIGWCKMDPGANPVLGGKTYAGFSSRSVPITILYNGDPKIVDGIGVRGAEGANTGGIAAPNSPPEPPKIKRAAPKPPTATPARATPDDPPS